MVDLKLVSGFGPPNIRPREGSDRRAYNPNRDIAYLTPRLAQLTTNSFYVDGQARKELDEAIEEVAYESCGTGCKENTAYWLQQFSDMCIAIGKFHTDFMRGVRTFDEALAASDIPKFPKWMFDLWLTHFGHTVFSAFYYGCRDIMFPGEAEPNNYAAIFDSAEKLRKSIYGKT